MLVLAIGDFFIPTRANSLPAKFKKLLSPSQTSAKISEVVCLGNLTASPETLKFLHELSPKLHLVKGESDLIELLTQELNQITGVKDQSIPLYNVITVGGLKIGFTLGSQVVPKNDPLVLLAMARDMDADVLIWGGTHKVEAYTLDGKFFVNPGSATGAFAYGLPDEEEEDDEEENENEGDKEDEKDVEKGEDSKKTEAEPTVESSESKNIAKDEEESEKQDPAQKESKEEGEDDKTDPEAEDVPLDFAVAYDQFTNIPSFCLLDVQGTTCTVYIYTYFDGEVKVDKVAYEK